MDVWRVRQMMLGDAQTVLMLWFDSYTLSLGILDLILLKWVMENFLIGV